MGAKGKHYGLSSSISNEGGVEVFGLKAFWRYRSVRWVAH